MNTKKMSALVIDKMSLVRESLQTVLKQQGFENIIFVDNAYDANSVLRTNNIDLLILDTQQQGFDGLDFLRRLKAKEFHGKVLFISSDEYDAYSNIAKVMGANGYILKTENLDVVKNAVSNVMNGYYVFKGHLRSDLSILSKREAIVFNYLMKGFTNKEISVVLSLSSKTVSTYKSRILKKYKVKTLLELMQINSLQQNQLSEYPN